MATVNIVLNNIVIAVNVHLLHHAEASAATIGIEARVINGPGIVNHRSGYLLALVVALYPPFFVANAPQNDGGVIAVIDNHAAQQVKMLLVGAHQAVRQRRGCATSG